MQKKLYLCGRKGLTIHNYEKIICSFCCTRLCTYVLRTRNYIQGGNNPNWRVSIRLSGHRNQIK